MLGHTFDRPVLPAGRTPAVWWLLWNPRRVRFRDFVYGPAFFTIPPRTRSQSRDLRLVHRDLGDAYVSVYDTFSTLQSIESILASRVPPPRLTPSSDDAANAPSEDVSLHIDSDLTSLGSSPNLSRPPSPYFELAPSVSQSDIPPPPTSDPAPLSSPRSSPDLSFDPTHPPVAMPPTPWPLTYSRDAPHFTGDSIGFDTFFDAVAELGRRAEADEKQCMEWACRYAGAESESWKSVRAFKTAGETFATFRDEVRKCYPHLDASRRFTFHDLEVLVQRNQTYANMTREDFGRYYRSFVTIADYLKENNDFSDRERGRRYLEGFPPPIRFNIAGRLALTKQNIIPADGYLVDNVHEAASYVFAAGGADYKSPVIISPALNATAATAPTTDPTSLKDIISSMSSMVTQSISAALKQQQSHQPPSQIRQPPPHLSSYPAPGGASFNPPRWAPSNFDNAPQGCVFCSAPEHYIRECPVVADYHRRGIINKNDEGKIVLPDGRYCPRNIPGKNMKERIDRFWESQNISGKGPTVATHFLETEDNYIFSMETSVFEDEAPGAADEPSAQEQIQILQAQIDSLRDPKTSASGGNRRWKFDGVEVPKRTIPDNRKPPSNQPGPIQPTIHSRPSRPVNPPQGQPPQGPMKPLNMPPRQSDEPKFKYQSPIETTVKVADLVDRTLDARITLSARELLAAAPEVRRQVRELVAGKKVAANFTEGNESVDSYLSTFLDEPGSTYLDVSKYDSEPTAVSSLPLRVIFPSFGAGVEPECILDGGAQVVVMRRDIWERLRVPVAANKAMTMESANSGTNTTLGLIENHPVRIGPVTIYLQIQVVENAPFEVLLGRPFFDVTNCTESSRTGGTHVIEIIDPKTKTPYVFPTQPRSRKGKQVARNESAVNFRR